LDRCRLTQFLPEYSKADFWYTRSVMFEVLYLREKHRSTKDTLRRAHSTIAERITG
jgi:hypothetical protein